MAAAALFAACKIEDTLKKSREILCAAHNLKLAPAEQANPDDPVSLAEPKTDRGPKYIRRYLRVTLRQSLVLNV